MEEKVLSKEAIDAYLDSYLVGRVLVVKDSKVIQSERTEFQNLPALKYEYTDFVDGVEISHKGTVFVIDGDVIALSMLTTTSNVYASRSYSEFVASFKLLPLAVALTDTPWRDSVTGISIRPPSNMSNLNRPRGRNGLLVMFANEAGHSMGVFDASSRTPGLTWSQLQEELRASPCDADGFYTNTLQQPGSQTRMTQIMCFRQHGSTIYAIQGYGPAKTFFRHEAAIKDAAKTLVFQNNVP